MHKSNEPRNQVDWSTNVLLCISLSINWNRLKESSTNQLHLQLICHNICYTLYLTGTLTTAKITIHAESVWYNGKFSKEDVALYSALASNRDKKEDPIDRSVINHFDKLFGPEGIIECSKFTKVRGVGFNPIYKRVVFEFTHPTLGTSCFIIICMLWYW